MSTEQFSGRTRMPSAVSLPARRSETRPPPTPRRAAVFRHAPKLLLGGAAAALAVWAGSKLDAAPIVCPEEPAFDLGLPPVDETVSTTAGPSVHLRPTTAYGARGVVVNARVQPKGRPTRVWVEHWSGSAEPQRTEPRELPGRLTAHLEEDWLEGAAGWQRDLQPKALVHGADPDGRTFVTHTEPSQDDRNHEDGIGVVHLAQYLYVGSLHEPTNVALGGGAPDLRDARIRVTLRGREFHAAGTELVFWAQSHHDLAHQEDDQWRASNWALTGAPLTSALLSGAWQTVEYRAWNDANEWTYAGKSARQRRENYQYLALDDTLANVNADVFHVLTYVDRAASSQGAIDFDAIRVDYRNHSLLAPSNGARLTRSPGPQDAAARLTDGWRHGPGREWSAAAPTAGPLELVYELERPVVIQRVQVHQSTAHPTRHVVVEASDDGARWRAVTALDLPERHPLGPNHAYALTAGLQAPARFVRVLLTAGFRDDAWGLGEVELFGTGAVEQTDDDWYGVNVDLPAAETGADLHYRVVAESDEGTTRSETRTVRRPVTGRPLVQTVGATPLSAGNARFDARVTPIGRQTEGYFEYGPTARYGHHSPRVHLGFLGTPRNLTQVVGDLTPGATYHFRAVSVNDRGVRCGTDHTFVAP